MRTPIGIQLGFAVGVLVLGPLALDAGPRRHGAEFSARRGDFTLAGGKGFVHYRIGLQFQVPLLAAGRIQRRGAFHEVQLRDAHKDRFVFYATTFRIRRADQLARWKSTIFGPCKPMKLPTGDNFRLEQRCKFRSLGNNLERRLLLVRKGPLLHLLYGAFRAKAAPQYDALFKSARLNPAFAAPAP